jgi:hypothetical protein
MSKMIKTSLVALSILAGASVGYAADNNNGGRSDFSRDGRPQNRVDTPDVWEREQMVDPNSTGSIVPCDSGAYDQSGNCIVDPDMQ